ncbi:MAG: hypothetical protein ACI82Z_001401 [Cellvibrionaceae bacterium]|jgi:hypothetical protein
MGGIGSGSYSRWNSKATTESTKRIDIRHMHKQGYLKPSTHGELSWTCGGKPSGNIRFIAYSRYLRLDYRFKQHDEEWQPVQQQIYYDYTPCHYGNSRQWFLCPKCHKRVAVLASDGPLFLCRHCYDLTYRSKNNNYIERLRDKRDSLGQRIFADFNGDYGCTKRKGMHQRTFDRLKEQYHQSDNHYHQAFENELFRLMQLP